MRTLKIIFLFLSISIFLHGKVNPSLKFINHNNVSKEKTGDLKHIKLFCDNNKNEKIILKKKHKPKGIENVNSVFSNISIDQICIYSDFLILISEIKYTSFLYCVERKRGPPFM